MKRCTRWLAAALLLAAMTTAAPAQENGDITPMTLEQRIAKMKADNEKLRQRLVSIETIVDEHVASNEQVRIRLEAAGLLLRELAMRIVNVLPGSAGGGEK